MGFLEKLTKSHRETNLMLIKKYHCFVRDQHVNIIINRHLNQID